MFGATHLQVGDVVSMRVREYSWWERCWLWLRGYPLTRRPVRLWRLLPQPKGHEVERVYTITSEVSDGVSTEGRT